MAAIPLDFMPDWEMDDEIRDELCETCLYYHAGLPHTVRAEPAQSLEAEGAAQLVSGRELPSELCEEILLTVWLNIPLFSPTRRWGLFANLSLVSRNFRQYALWMATRHVRALAHCSMDIDAYRSIGRQCLALRNPDANEDEKTFVDAPFGASTVHLDITYAIYWALRDRDRWLKDDISPGRPDDVHGIRFNLFDGPIDAAEYSYPFPERREPEYLDWLARRRRDALSGWFADLLSAVPECTTAVISTDRFLSEPFCPLTYSMVLEALWWWKTLEYVDLRVVPESPSFFARMSGMAGGPLPPLPALPSVKRVRMSKCTSCTCSAFHDSTCREDCMTQRMLVPFPGLRVVEVDVRPQSDSEQLIIPPGVEVVLGTSNVSKEEGSQTHVYNDTIAYPGPFDDKSPSDLWVPWLHISLSDELWETVDPERTRFEFDKFERL
ncbi:hypothetical protein C8Q79DRAFT_134925 [Trametes meyenii]|nr:hypothetical protein C8Q79DRAFT_134925 [Trametes meyenii]